jgi:hypothetical protein
VVRISLIESEVSMRSKLRRLRAERGSLWGHL